MITKRSTTITLLAIALTLGSSASFGQEPQTQKPSSATASDSLFESWGAQLGYITGNLKANNGDDLQMLMLLSRFKHPINDALGLENHKGKISLVLEPFLGQIYAPENGALLGIGGFFEYAYPVTEKWSLQTGFGSGPSYFGIDTIEEGKAGFQFFDSASAGVSYNRNEDDAFLFEFRAIHISNLSIRLPNNGINGYSFFFGYNSKF